MRMNQALLGSPNASGIAFLLVQHKAELGDRYVEKIQVFSPDEGGNPSVLFYIVEG